MRLSSSVLPVMIYMQAIERPAKIATKLPSRLPGASWSRKKSAMPHIVTDTVITSARENFWRRKIADKIRMKTGAVNWSTMAFAAVVSLLAETKARKVSARKTPLTREARLRRSRCFVARR